ncbi:MAG: RdgB/HAM1 family non-canonical purine NTP pyrophosphatase [bacterium]
MEKKQIVLATRNQDKLKEIRDVFKSDYFELISWDTFDSDSEIIEDGDTLLANATKKAEVVFHKTGLPTLADDTGLEVEYLDGQPGVKSSRFAGENVTYEVNNRKLLDVLKNVPWEERNARFRTIVVFKHNKVRFNTEGICQGIIHTELTGDNGFGYDPLFYIPEKKKTFAEMKPIEKNRISHRGIAFKKMANILKNKANEIF